MTITKHNRIFTPAAGHWAQCPVVQDMGAKWRIYFADRNTAGQAYITFIEVEADNPTNLLYCHCAPITSPGRPGTFDEHGMMPSSIARVGEETYLYYTGWRKLQGGDAKYENAVGVLRVRGNWFRRISSDAVLPPIDEYFTAHLTIQLGYDDTLVGLYSSCVAWVSGEPLYDLKMATSSDGLNWARHGVVVPLAGGDAGLCSAHRATDNTLIYGARKGEDYREGTGAYRIKHSVLDGTTWHQRGPVEQMAEAMPGAWDYKMQCYPYVFTSPRTGIKYLFYNGNGFGQSGIGYATLQP